MMRVRAGEPVRLRYREARGRGRRCIASTAVDDDVTRVARRRGAPQLGPNVSQRLRVGDEPLTEASRPVVFASSSDDDDDAQRE